MKRFRTALLTAFAVLLVVVPAASAETLIGSGSVAMQPYIVALTAKYHKLNPSISFAYNADGGNAGVKDVQAGKSQFAGQARAPLPSDGGTTYTEAFKDGMAIVVNKKNPVKNLTLQQISDIYTAKVTNWSSIPGAKISTVIAPFGRESSSGQYTYFVSGVLNGANQASNVTTVLSDGLVRNGVKSSKGGIGYIGEAFLNNQIKPVTVNNVAVNQKNVKSNKYPLSRYLYFVTPTANVNPDVAAFIDWVRTSYAARLIIQKTGGVAIFNSNKKPKKSSAASFENRLLGL